MHIDNNHFYGLIPKISKSAKKGPFLNIFNFLMNLDFLSLTWKLKNELHSDDNDEYVSDDEYKLVSINDDEVSKIMCMLFVNIDNNQFYGLISKISKSAKKGLFWTFSFFWWIHENWEWWVSIMNLVHLMKMINIK